MNIVVLVKQVPDTEGARTLDPADNTVDRAGVDPVVNYIDEFAIEEGLQLTDQDKADLVNFLKCLTDPDFATNEDFSDPHE